MAEKQDLVDLFSSLKDLFVSIVRQDERLVAVDGQCIRARASTRLKQGDLLIVAIDTIRKAIDSSKDQAYGQNEAAKAIVDRLSRLEAKPDFFQSFSVTPAGHIAVFLAKQLVYASCIAEVRRAGPRYGFVSTCTEDSSPHGSEAEADVLVFLHSTPHREDTDQCAIGSQTCALVRSELLAVLLVHLLKHTGQKATLVANTKVPSCMPMRASLTPIDLGRINDEFAAKLPACVDIQDVVKNYELLQGKSGISSDIRSFQTVTPSGARISEAVYGLKLAAVLSPRYNVKHRCLHVCSHGNSHFTQKSLAVALHQDPKLLLNHHLVAHCGVRDSTTGSSDALFSTLYRMHLKQMEVACAVKCGDVPATNSPLAHTVSTMADAVIRFELLATELNSPVKLSLGDTADGSQCKAPGSFVLYNYARMCTVLANFNKAVAAGMYPNLPPVDSMDFSLLKEEAEWCLLFKYILQFPSLISEMASSVAGGAFRVVPKVNKLCSFLIQLSSDYSVYYSKIRVLMDPQPHLFPLVHARIYLLLAIRQVMYNALHLLGIEPLEKL